MLLPLSDDCWLFAQETDTFYKCRTFWGSWLRSKFLAWCTAKLEFYSAMTRVGGCYWIFMVTAIKMKMKMDHDCSTIGLAGTSCFSKWNYGWWGAIVLGKTSYLSYGFVKWTILFKDIPVIFGWNGLGCGFEFHFFKTFYCDQKARAR